MKAGIEKIPTINDLKRAYDLLQFKWPKQSEYTLATLTELSYFCVLSRFDARLAEIIVEFFFENWRKINPVSFNALLLSEAWPNTAAVLLEFSAGAISVAKKECSVQFNLWRRIILCNLSKAGWEQFFIGAHPIGSRAMFDNARFPLVEYRKWGYFGREILFNKAVPSQMSFDIATRIEIIKSLLEDNGRLDTNTYWAALGKSISKRQAERDLKACPFLEAIGKTKARVFHLKKLSECFVRGISKK